MHILLNKQAVYERDTKMVKVLLEFVAIVMWALHFSDETRDHGGCPRGVMVKALDCRIAVSEFELQLRYYVHFRTNTLGKGMNLLILLAMG